MAIEIDETETVSDDDNEEIIKELMKRLQFGRDKYGHGVRVDDDTRNVGNTRANSWIEMAVEEALDQCIYLTASLLRIKRASEEYHQNLKTAFWKF